MFGEVEVDFTQAILAGQPGAAVRDRYSAADSG